MFGGFWGVFWCVAGVVLFKFCKSMGRSIVRRSVLEDCVEFPGDVPSPDPLFSSLFNNILRRSSLSIGEAFYNRVDAGGLFRVEEGADALDEC